MARERAQSEISGTCNKACEILKKTGDGDLLDPSDLKMVELAVNGYLSAEGREVFDKLYLRVVVDGTYVKPYLHGIKHITRDHEGYIYYKGVNIEHYDSDYVYSVAAKNELLELKRRCEFLERKGIEVSGSSVIWGWHKHSEEYSAKRLKELDSMLGAFGLVFSRVEIYNSGREFTFFMCGKPEGLEEIKNHPVTQSMIGRYFDDEYEIKVESFAYHKPPAYHLVVFKDPAEIAEVESLLASCHGHMLRHGKLESLSATAHKTDFAEGYEKVKMLDSLLDSPGRSLQYSEVFMYGYGYSDTRLYIVGIPTLDEIKVYYEYGAMKEIYGDRLTVSMTSFQYGDGEPLKPDELPNTAAVADKLGETHGYLHKHGLSHETLYKDFTRGVEVGHADRQSEPDYEADDGYEP